jgi:hypothetical protein
MRWAALAAIPAALSADGTNPSSYLVMAIYMTTDPLGATSLVLVLPCNS